MTENTVWTDFRSQIWLDPGSVYLNTGSYAPLAKPVGVALAALRQQMAASPSDFLWRRAPVLLDQARAALAQYLNVAGDDLLLLPNVTWSINLVAQSLALPPGSEVLLTDQEYGAMRYCWRDRAAKRGWQVREVPIPITPREPAEIVDAVLAGVTPRTRVLFFSHVTSPTGLVLPAPELCRRAAERGLITVIDGAHAPGMVPLDLAQLGADFYGGNCHKWLLGPVGAGFLHVNRRRRESLEPMLISWGAEYDRSRAEADSGWGGSFWARNFEFHGTQDRSGAMVLPEVIGFRARVGEATLRERMQQLAEYAIGRFANTPLACVTPEPAALRGSIVAFATPPLDPVKARDWLWHTHRIEAPFTAAAGRCFLRVSAAPFNTPAEIDLLAEAVRTLPVDRLQ